MDLWFWCHAKRVAIKVLYNGFLLLISSTHTHTHCSIESFNFFSRFSPSPQQTRCHWQTTNVISCFLFQSTSIWTLSIVFILHSTPKYLMLHIAVFYCHAFRAHHDWNIYGEIVLHEERKKNCRRQNANRTLPKMPKKFHFGFSIYLPRKRFQRHFCFAIKVWNGIRYAVRNLLAI